MSDLLQGASWCFIIQSLHGGHGSGLARRRRGPGLLEAQHVNDGQDACGVEDGQAHKPSQLVVARALPQGNQLPYAIPDGDEEDY